MTSTRNKQLPFGKPEKVVYQSFFLFILVFILSACNNEPEPVSFERHVTTVGDLADHNKEFDKPEIIPVTEGVYVAVGFGLANSILIEGENGNIIVDCMESNETAEKVKAEFDKISDKPIKAIIYTHNHADHIFGSEIMAGKDQPDIYSHELTNYYIDRLLSVVRPIIGVRAYRMFGTYLDSESHAGCGIGPRLDANPNTTRSLLRPTITFEDTLETEIEGVKIKLVHAPGETNDQLFVWLPEKKVLLPGDNIYKAFPNLYTIRGTPYRDVNLWAQSLDKMRYLKPDFVIPSHTRPIVGQENIQAILQDYRDGIQYVHDQTIRLMNKGLTPDEIAETLVLPPHLSQSPYLKEFYGKVNWSVKNIFTGYLGFFDGNSSTLLPLPTKEKAQKMVDLAGGFDGLKTAAEEALRRKEFQWGLELTDYLLKVRPDSEDIKDIRYQCLFNLGQQQSNPNARNYYLSQAVEIKNEDLSYLIPTSVEIAHTIPLEAYFQSMAVRLVPEKAATTDQKAVFYFTDTKEHWSIHVRRGVAEVQNFALSEPDLKVETTSTIWKELAARHRNPMVTYAKGELKVEEGVSAFGAFMAMFREN